MNQLLQLLAANPDAVVPLGVILGEFFVLLAADHERTGFNRFLVAAEITSFTAAATLLGGSTVAASRMNTNVPIAGAVFVLGGYLGVVPVVLVSQWARTDRVKAEPIERLRTELARYPAGIVLFVLAGAYLAMALYLARPISAGG